MATFVVKMHRIVEIERTVEATSAANARRIAEEFGVHDFALDGNISFDDTKIRTVKRK